MKLRYTSGKEVRQLKPDQPCDVLIGGLDNGKRLPGEQRYGCGDCGGFTWLPPSCQELIAQFPATKVVCLLCGKKLVSSAQEAEVCTVAGIDELLAKFLEVLRTGGADGLIDRLRSPLAKGWTQ